MTIEDFYFDSTKVYVNVSSPLGVPLGVTLTDADGNDTFNDTADSFLGSVYYYTFDIVVLDGIFTAVATHASDDPVQGIMGSLARGVSYLAYKVAKEELDCYLLQELYATENYIISNDDANARSVYGEVQRKATLCLTDYSYDLVNVAIVIKDGNHLKV